MSVAEEEDQPMRETKYPHLRVATGGKGPPNPPDDGIDWLSNLELGSVFVCRAKVSQDLDCNLYHLVYKDTNVSLLRWELPDGKLLDIYVEPDRFSRKMRFLQLLGVHKREPQQEAKEKDDGIGNGDRTD